MAIGTYNVNDTATRVLMAKKLKENIFVGLLHRNEKGITEHYEVNASTIRRFKATKLTGEARKLGEATNGGFLNSSGAKIPQVTEKPLDLLYIYDQVYDLPEVQQDMVEPSLLDASMKNIAGLVNTHINASTLATQITPKFNQADTENAWGDNVVEIGNGVGADVYYNAFMDASTMLDNGDDENGVQMFPFEERECIVRPRFRQALMSEKGVILGGSNYAQSMLAKGVISPDDAKDFGNKYIGEIDAIPVYLCPDGIWKEAGKWVNDGTAFDDVEALMCTASATDRGISDQEYVKVIDCPTGAGKRLQPKIRWGVEVYYEKGIIPIVKNGATVPSTQLTVMAPGSRA